MKVIVDSGPIISLSKTCLFSLLEEFEELFDVSLVLPGEVYRELIERPMHSERFELSALNILKLVEKGVLDVKKLNQNEEKIAEKIMYFANNIFKTRRGSLRILQKGEAECLALISEEEKGFLLVDERNTRLLIEDPYLLYELISERFRGKLKMDERMLSSFRELVGDAITMRSLDLAGVLYEKGSKLIKTKEHLRAVLYALKFSGCSGSFEEIREYLR